MDFHEFERAGWEDASVCSRYHEGLSAVTEQSIPSLLDAAGVRSGVYVLDVATGAGYAAQRAVARGARPVGVDFSTSQLKLARGTGLALSCAACDAGALPFTGDTFDAVITNYGIPHFPDPAVAIAECVRVLKPGGRFAFSVWETPDKAVGFGAIYAAVQAHGRMDVGLPPGPNFFLFSDPDQSRLAMKSAGLEDVAVIQAPQVWRAASPDAVLETIRNGTVRAGALLRAQTTQAMQAIRQHVWDALQPFQRGGGYEIPMPAMVAAGVKRGASRS